MTEDQPNYSIGELMACVFARDIKDGEVGLTGASSLIPMAACQLAKNLHAPNMNWIGGGSGSVNSTFLTKSSADYNLAKNSEGFYTMSQVMAFEEKWLSFFFVSGLQIDPKGNINLYKVGNLRGPGSVGLPLVPSARRYYIYHTKQSNKVFVPEVDYISGRGLIGEGIGSNPSLLVSNLGVYQPRGDFFEVISLHPNITLEQAQEASSADMISKGTSIKETDPPSQEELKLLRKIDFNRLL